MWFRDCFEGTSQKQYLGMGRVTNGGTESDLVKGMVPDHVQEVSQPGISC